MQCRFSHHKYHRTAVETNTDLGDWKLRNCCIGALPEAQKNILLLLLLLLLLLFIKYIAFYYLAPCFVTCVIRSVSKIAKRDY
jgi:hypothetical protein